MKIILGASEVSDPICSNPSDVSRIPTKRDYRNSTEQAKDNKNGSGQQLHKVDLTWMLRLGNMTNKMECFVPNFCRNLNVHFEN